MAPEIQAEPKYWTVPILAERFRVSRWTVYRACRAPEPDRWPHSRVGGIRFSDAQVAEIEERIRVASAPASAPKYPAKQLAKAAERLGLPAPRRGS